jgi:pilus assembly protein Flp/PilA
MRSVESLRSFTVRLWSDESGQDLVEYALVGALIGLAAVTSIKSLGSAVTNLFTSINTRITSAT